MVLVCVANTKETKEKLERLKDSSKQKWKNHSLRHNCAKQKTQNHRAQGGAAPGWDGFPWLLQKDDRASQRTNFFLQQNLLGCERVTLQRKGQPKILSALLFLSPRWSIFLSFSHQTVSPWSLRSSLSQISIGAPWNWTRFWKPQINHKGTEQPSRDNKGKARTGSLCCCTLASHQMLTQSSSAVWRKGGKSPLAVPFPKPPTTHTSHLLYVRRSWQASVKKTFLDRRRTASDAGEQALSAAAFRNLFDTFPHYFGGADHSRRWKKNKVLWASTADGSFNNNGMQFP